MNGFNKVIVMGNLTYDPQLRYLANGTTVSDVSLAVNRTYKNSNGEKREETDFVDVTLWGRTAEVAVEYLKKGRTILVEGRLQQEKWQDKETGNNRSKLKVVCESMQMVGYSKEDS